MKLAEFYQYLKESEYENSGKSVEDAPDPGASEYITTAQAAKILGCVPSRIRQLIGDGTLKSHNKDGRDNLLKQTEVREYKKNSEEKKED